ncbi:DNA binding domain-containing protein, excisionase family [Polynucleobacter meluiroseus]|uniref:DNA binding domain-containing protein, excisionase family n=1 Tax=Polynucleobacter meluiroseus TaxID=1938814 RepID=A0A240E1E1_9BURK|nr:excisionase family DNA-binding protein [Polynucleobacter meluiroseus]SNX28680.1 DNA binding domain-containing protein, excisionase family [Polynucleobacter meluiroseus]
MKAITPEMEYLSTRQSAKVLQVSLGTVQKMVELGELIAWKTRGGHRRILASSLEQQLQRRKRAMRQKTTQNCIALGIFRRFENSQELMNAIQYWQIKVELDVAVDSMEGLMKAVSIAPDLIFLDALIPPVEQVHLIHYLSKNKDTQRIPILVDEGFIKLHPGVISLVDENTLGVRPQYPEKLQEELENGLIEHNPLIIPYCATNAEADSNLGGENRLHLLEPIFTQALSRKCML